jgi:hypothetical protein
MAVARSAVIRNPTETIQMDRKQHAWLARQLIEACGGLKEIEAAGVCRLKRSRLSEYQDPIGRAGIAEAYMPADVLADLELYCGKPIYSRGLLEAHPGHVDTEGLLSEACSTTEAAAELQKTLRKALADPGRLSRAARQHIGTLLATVDQELREVTAEAAREGMTP